MAAYTLIAKNAALANVLKPRPPKRTNESSTEYKARISAWETAYNSAVALLGDLTSISE